MKTNQAIFKDNSRLPAIVSAYELIMHALRGLAVVKNCTVTLNRFYLENEFYHFNFSVFLKGKECKYLITCTNNYDEWSIRSSKWNGQREPIDTTSLSFGKFIRKDDHKDKKDNQ